MFRGVSRQVGIIAAVTAVGLLCAPFASWMTMVIAWLLLASVVVFNLGIFSRLVLVVFVYGVMGAIVLQLSSMLGLNPPFEVLQAVLLLVACMYIFIFRDKVGIRTEPVDMLGLAVGIGVFLFVALPVLGASGSKTLVYLMPGEDNGSHFQMYRYVLTEHHYAYNNNPEQAGIRPTLLSYAQGSHAAMAMVTAPFVQRSSTGDQLRAYVIAAAWTFAATFWVGFLVIAQPLLRIKSWWLRFAIGSLVALLYAVNVPLGLLLSLYTYGYYPQYYSYLGFAFLLLVVLSIRSKASVGRRALAFEAVMLLLGFYSVLSAWYLMAPMAVFPVLAYVWLRRYEIVNHKQDMIGITLFAGVIFTYLAYVFAVKSSGSGHLLTTGGVEKMRISSILLGVPALGLVIRMVIKRQWRLVAFSLSFLGTVAFAILIGVYQKHKIGHVDYYFYKILFSVVFLAVIYYGYLFVRTLTKALKGAQHTQANYRGLALPTLGLLVLCIVITMFNPSKYFSDFQTVKYAIPGQGQDRILDVFTNERIYDRYSDVIALNYCNPYANFTTTIWAGSFFLPYSPERQKIEDSVLSRRSELSLSDSPLLVEIGQYAKTKNKPVGIIGPESCLGKDNVARMLKGQNVVFISSTGEELDH